MPSCGVHSFSGTILRIDAFVLLSVNKLPRKSTHLCEWFNGSSPGYNFVVFSPAGLLAPPLDIFPAIHDGEKHAVILFHAITLW